MSQARPLRTLTIWKCGFGAAKWKRSNVFISFPPPPPFIAIQGEVYMTYTEDGSASKVIANSLS